MRYRAHARVSPVAFCNRQLAIFVTGGSAEGSGAGLNYQSHVCYNFCVVDFQNALQQLANTQVKRQ